MKKFALAVVLIAFGALMVAGCPADNTAKSGNSGSSNAPAGNGNK